MNRFAKGLFVTLALLASAPQAGAQCGLMLVSGNTTGYTTYVQSPILANDDVSNTWSLSQAAINDYAIFQTHDPWGGVVLKTAITNAGHTYTVFAPSALTGFPFSNYRVIILNWDDTDVSAFDPPYSSVIPALQTYVQNGGALWLQGCIQQAGGTTYPLPFGGTATFDLENYDFIADPSSPWIAGVTNPLYGTYASHVNFSGYPASSKVVETVGMVAGGNTVVYTYQTGGLCPPTNTPAPTMTMTPTNTPTITPTPSPTNSPTLSPTNTPTGTPTPTFTPTWTYTPTCVSYLWPDPYNPKYAVNGTLKISCLPPGSTVSFFTLAGELVIQLPESGLMLQWDGKNQQGIPVATGIYFYVIQNGSKVLGKGKFLVNH